MLKTKEKDPDSPRKSKVKIRDQNAPHRPVNPFMLYLRLNRERSKTENPNTSTLEITKILAKEWVKLTDEEKQPYMKQAEDLKVKYREDLSNYKASDAFKAFEENRVTVKTEDEENVTESPVKKRGRPRKLKPWEIEEQQQQLAKKNKKIGRPPLQTKKDPLPPSQSIPMIGDLKVFTEEFLEENKVRETELRKLRRLTTDFEEQNAILSKHIDHMKSVEVRLAAEMAQMEQRNEVVEQHLLRLKKEFVESFASTPVPGTKEYPTLDNLDDYLDRMQKRLSQCKTGDVDDGLRDRVKSFITKFASIDIDV